MFYQKFRYDVLLGLPTHVDNNPKNSYLDRRVHVGKEYLYGTVEFSNYPCVEETKVMNSSGNRFRRTIQKHLKRG